MTTLEPTNPKSAPLNPANPNADDSLRPHSFDGIQEYDKRLPRWWLLTLYGAMTFAVAYWGYYHAYHLGPSPTEALALETKESAARAAAKSGVLDDELLWKMSRNAAVLATGKVTFETTCAACHKPDLSGLIGPNLVDNQWIHGGLPMNAMKTIEEGVLTKGMPAWGPILGKQKISEVVAYIYAHHEPGETVVAVPGWTPPAIPAPAAPPATP